MKETALAKRRVTEKEKGRYEGGKPELRDAMQVVDTLMRSATETETQNATLEAMLLRNEAQYINNTDAMFDEWLAYNEIKRTEVNNMLESHATELKARDIKVKALEAELKISRARIENEKQKVKIRDARLAKVKTHWLQEQDLMEEKFREMQQIAVDLDDLSKLNYDSDDCDEDESDSEAEPKEVNNRTTAEHKVQHEVERKDEQKENREPKQEPMEAQEVKKVEQPGAKGVGGLEMKRSIVRERVQSLEVKDVVNIDVDDDEEEEEDEGPISSHQKRKAK